MKEIKLKGEYITLGQVLKLESYISSGGEAKIFLSTSSVLVNEKLETRRGRKLYIGDIITINNNKYKIV